MLVTLVKLYRKYIYQSCIKLLSHILKLHQPIPVAERYKAWVCGRSLAGIAGSNPAGGMDVCLL